MLTLIDRGGTFTDVVRIGPDGDVRITKVPSDRAVVGELAEGSLRFGTTVATNALLERTGVRTLALVPEGLEDAPWIGDMARPDLFDPTVRWPEPLCAAAIGVRGRLDRDGREVEPLELPDPSVLDGFDAVAVALLHSGRHPAHELLLGDWLRAVRPDLHVALGHEVQPGVGWLARLETALVHAAISPVLTASLRRDRIPAGALAMRSDGGLCPVDRFIAPDAVLSGPAGGVLAVRAVARMAGFAAAVGLDMGGTSTDVCRVSGDLPRRTGDVRVAGVRLRRPMLAVDTIAAGGGSICWNDGTRIGVGPRSAGADPGPQAYGRGGPPTVTDAAVLCGLVDVHAFDPPLQPDRIALPGPPEAFLAVAREAMAAAVRRLALQDGADLRDHALVAFGGAAGQHAAAVAELLGVGTVLIHPCASVLSAWGQALAREEAVATADPRVLLGDPGVEACIGALTSGLPDLGGVETTVVLRARGTQGDLELPWGPDVGDRFAEAHRARFGFVPAGPIEARTVTVRAHGPEPSVPALAAGLSDWVCVQHGVRAPWAGGIAGPAVLHGPTTSVEVPEGWTAHDSQGLLRLERASRGGARPRMSDAPADADARALRAPESPGTPGSWRVVPENDPVGTALWGARFMAVAEQGGAVLQRLARSVNVRERLDFSCAVFDGDGLLVANAPHIPVHLGAMGVTVRDLIARHDPPVGTHWLCNDPAAGGSHLPDLTVISAVDLGNGARAFVGCRAHHVDVGGSTPGSMPPRSTRLDEEGLVFRHVRLAEDGSGADLTGSRQPDVVRADLAAQVACNRAMGSGLRALGPPSEVLGWAARLLDAAEALVDGLIARLPSGSPVVTDRIDGVPLMLSLRRDGRDLVVDLTGTGGPHPGNLNAPLAVVRAAVLYALRVLIAADIPLNEGVLRRVRVVTPAPSLVDPPAGAAIAGGNVETSMRIADLVLSAAGRFAGSAGTMNNLTLGGAGWAYYETLGGGQGAGPDGPGASARQLHMTNTRATDPEVLEHRLPLRVRRFGIRRGSGGGGVHAGGDGLVRELEVLEPATACLLATRRRAGAAGMGGSDGAPGEDTVVRRGVPEPWDGDVVALEPGDRVIVRTPGGGGWSRG